MLEKLIGGQILKIDESTISVKLGEDIYTLEILTDEGDCCGYADFEMRIKYSENDSTNPIITNIDSKEDGTSGGVNAVITFYGEHKELVEIEAHAGSGSGWAYGAIVNLHCKALDIDETLATW